MPCRVARYCSYSRKCTSCMYPLNAYCRCSMQTRGGISFIFSKSNLAVTTCRHLGTMVTSCATLTSHALLFCADLSKGGLSKLRPLGLVSSLRVWRGLSPSCLSLGNTVRAACFVGTPHAYGSSLLSTNDNFPYQNWFLRQLCPKICTKLTIWFGWKGHTRNVWLNFLPARTKETRCSPCMSRVTPVTPQGFTAMLFMSLLDTPGCNIDTFEPVSTIKYFSSSSVSNETVG